jgi:hypothetical protein
MWVQIDTTSGYRKLIDFKNLTADAGLYNLNTALNFFPVATGPSNAFETTKEHEVVITRDGVSGAFVGYVDGLPQLSFNDLVSLYATFSGPNNIIHFLRDDTVTGGAESTGGFLDRIRIYDSPLSSADVAALFAEGQPSPSTVVPEPSSWLVMSLLAAIVPFTSGVRLKRSRIPAQSPITGS